MSEPRITVSDALIERFRTIPFSYPEIGATRQERLPRGYRHLERQVDAGRGEQRYHELSERLSTWQLHAQAGLALQVSDERARQGSIQLATLSLGPGRIKTRCRVVYVIAEERRSGFAYGTLEGHPERGEEQFTVALTDDERVVFSLRAFSRNAWLFARLGSPVSNRVQAMINRRYLAAAVS